MSNSIISGQPQNNLFNFSPESSSTLKDCDKIHKLYSKFLQASNEIEISHDMPNFSVVDIQKEVELDDLYDSSLQKAKLKRIENNFQLHRANMELKKRQHKKSDVKRKVTNQPPSISLKRQRANSLQFKTIYQNFRSQHRQVNLLRNRRNSINSMCSIQFQGMFQNLNQKEELVEGLSHYDQLKKYPLLLSYTIKQVKERKREKDIREDIKNEKIREYVEEMDSFCIPSQKAHFLSERTKASESEVIVDNRMRKIYAKKTKKANEMIDNSPEISDFRQRQLKILSFRKQNSLSSDYKEKLQQKLDSIALQLFQNRRAATWQRKTRANFSARLKKSSCSTFSHQI